MVMLFAALGYVILMPILLWGIGFAQKKLIVERAMAKRGPRSRAANVPALIWPTWKERLSYSFKDKRPLQIKDKELGIKRNQFFILLWILGLGVSMGGTFLGSWQITTLGYALFFVFTIFGIVSPKTLLETRKKVTAKMFDIAKTRLGQSGEYNDNPGAVVRILEWRDLVKPMRVEFDVPTTFDMSGEENFQKLFNQVFGNETSFVSADDPEKGTPGWDYEKGMVTLKAVPPLPSIAPWDEHYITDPGVAWSFFPIGLGVENGLELVNPKTGEIENVLGFDLNGEQMKLSKKMSIKMGSEISQSPMVFIGGSTGGGKALALDTPIAVLRPISKSLLAQEADNVQL